MSADQPPPEPRYIGDGVYASFDGFQIWLGLEAGQQLIALDPFVLAALNDYWQALRGKTNEAESIQD